jgi:hypothetical protein
MIVEPLMLSGFVPQLRACRREPVAGGCPVNGAAGVFPRRPACRLALLQRT